jgi:NAD(P)-dependent dehydrogenase (short-subunit alcohol dehydrogenase family)
VRAFSKQQWSVRLIGSMIIVLFSLVASAQADSQADGYTPAVFITGANRGLGLEFTRQYAAMGWTVIATTRNPDGADDLQALAAQHPGLRIEQLDVTDFEQIDALAEKYKEQPIDVLLNNAGISGSPSPKQLFQRLDYSLFDDYMHVNALGPLKISEAFLPHVRAGRLKRIATVSSLGGSFAARDRMAPGTMFYRASKSALNMLMINVAAGVKKYDITVVLLNPGLVDTQGVLTEMNEKMNMGLDLTLIDESIAGMIDVIATAELEKTGTIYQYTGQELEY